MSTAITKALLGVCFHTGVLSRRYYATISVSKPFLERANEFERKKGDPAIALSNEHPNNTTLSLC
jgi:hypothetical protein